MNVFLGSLLLVPYKFAPAGWAHCHGQLMNISQNTALFSLIGTTFGGDGITTFALPDHRTHEGIGLHWIIALQGIFPSRS
jgi:microcystin-dependent protein